MLAFVKVLAVPAVALGGGVVVLVQAVPPSSLAMAIVAVVAALATSVVAIGGFVLSARGWIVDAVIDSTRVQERIDARAEHKAANAVTPLVQQMHVIAKGVEAVQEGMDTLRDKLHGLETTVARTGSDLAALERLMKTGTCPREGARKRG